MSHPNTRRDTRQESAGPDRAALRIAVIGHGRAGRARVRAIEAHPRAELAAIVSRGGAPESTLDAVLASRDVDAAIVCTPNALHPPQAEAALRAGKHVLVEFPLAPDVATARELYALARERGMTLHVGHIELLAPSQRALRERYAALGPARGGEVVFTGSSDGWIGDDALAGSPALRAVARLNRLVDLLGPAIVCDAAIERTDGGGYALAAELAFGPPEGGTGRAQVTLEELRGPELPRGTRWGIECAGGILDDPPATSASGVFEADLDSFVAQVLDGAPSYVTEERVLHLLELVEEIDRRTGTAAASGGREAS